MDWDWVRKALCLSSSEWLLADRLVCCRGCRWNGKSMMMSQTVCATCGSYLLRLLHLLLATHLTGCQKWGERKNFRNSFAEIYVRRRWFRDATTTMEKPQPLGWRMFYSTLVAHLAAAAPAADDEQNLQYSQYVHAGSAPNDDGRVYVAGNRIRWANERKLLLCKVSHDEASDCTF